MKRILTLLSLLALAAAGASATPFTYIVQVDTPNFGVTGWIDFSFVQNNSFTSLPATASVYNFQQTGFTLDPTIQTSGPGVTGTLDFPPVLIPNDEGAANYFTQHVTTWGNSFRFSVTFGGPAVGASAPDGSVFRVTLYDESFNILAAPLLDGAVADVFLNPDGTLSGLGSTFDGGSATANVAPEPGTLLLAAGALGAVLAARRRR